MNHQPWLALMLEKEHQIRNTWVYTCTTCVKHFCFINIYVHVFIECFLLKVMFIEISMQHIFTVRPFGQAQLMINMYILTCIITIN